MKNLIDLAQFRENNNITQSFLAEFLGTSRSYISLVESGRSKLSKQKIDKIMDEGRSSFDWDISPLNPAFYRLNEVCQRYACDNPYPLNWNTGESILRLLPSDILKIKYGKSEITEEMAKKICSQFPSIEKHWLMYGSGSMLSKDNPYKEYDHPQRTSNEEKIEFLTRKLLELEEKVNSIINAGLQNDANSANKMQ